MKKISKIELPIKPKFKKVIRALYLCGVELNNNFETRLKYQKIVCLLQMMGIDFGYEFKLYIKGAYSYELAEDFFETCNNLDELIKKSPELAVK